jgi:hypothetical protein
MIVKSLFFFILIQTSAFSQENDLNVVSVDSLFTKESLAQYSVFVTPEVHWDPVNLERQKLFISKLMNVNNLDVIVLERSYAHGYFLNQYMKSGDTNLLKGILNGDSYVTSRAGVKVDYFNYYQWLRALMIKKKNHVKMLGIDFEVNWKANKVMWYFLEFCKTDKELSLQLFENILEAEKLLNKKKLSAQRMYLWLTRLEKVISVEDVKNEFLQAFIRNVNQSKKFTYKFPRDEREHDLLVNFEKYVSINERVYAQFGIVHTTLAIENQAAGFVSFVSNLNKSVWRDRILSIGLVSYNGDVMNDYPGPDLYKPFLTDEEYIRLTSFFKPLPTNSFIDFRGSNEKIQKRAQIILIEHNTSGFQITEK